MSMFDESSYIVRYEEAMHAVQSGVAMQMADGSQDTLPKHLRVGVNSALVNNSAIATILIDKGICTQLEYYKALAEAAEREKVRYELELSAKHGTKITLV